MVEAKDILLVGIGFGIGFLVFSALGQSLIKSAYKLTEAEVKKLERRARERTKKEEEKIEKLK